MEEQKAIDAALLDEILPMATQGMAALRRPALAAAAEPAPLQAARAQPGLR